MSQTNEMQQQQLNAIKELNEKMDKCEAKVAMLENFLMEGFLKLENKINENFKTGIYVSDSYKQFYIMAIILFKIF